MQRMYVFHDAGDAGAHCDGNDVMSLIKESRTVSYLLRTLHE